MISLNELQLWIVDSCSQVCKDGTAVVLASAALCALPGGIILYSILKRDIVTDSLKLQRIAPSWSAQLKPYSDGKKPSLWLEITNDGAMPGTFVPLALEFSDLEIEFKKLELQLMPGFQSNLVGPGRSIVFELIAELKEPLEEGMAVQLDLLYAGISPRSSEWYSRDRDAAVLSLPILIESTIKTENDHE